MIFEPSAKLSRMLAWSDKLSVQHLGTWSELFKTKKFLRVEHVRDELIIRIRKQIIKEAKMDCEFHAKAHRLHAHSAYFSIKRIGYKYAIECTPVEAQNETN